MPSSIISPLATITRSEFISYLKLYICTFQKHVTKSFLKNTYTLFKLRMCEKFMDWKNFMHLPG